MVWINRSPLLFSHTQRHTQAHPFFEPIEWAAIAQKATKPPWLPPATAVTPDTSIGPRDVAREAKLKAVMLTAQVSQ